jgi:hypothetical protein
MAGTFTPKVMAQGQFANSKGTLYTVPGSTSAYVKFFNVWNSSATPQTVRVYLNPAGTSRQIITLSLAQNESANIIDLVGSFTLEAGDLIEGDTTTATVLDYVITGVEET